MIRFYHSPVLASILFLVLALATSGCIYSREISNTRRVIEDEIPGSQFDRKIVLSIGSGTLRTAGWLTSLIPDEDMEEVRLYLDDVERIKVGIYETESLPDDGSSGAPMLSDMVERGWEVAVRVRDERDRVWLMYRSHRNRVRALFVIVLNEDNLVIARVEGHLDRILQRAMADYRPFSRLANRRSRDAG
ncbi:MAG: DUF4252 domain-containing protein [Rhodothermales bacterium]|nr:DUF4252 domain-containing protein [Rhodothermales bacterium]